MKQIKLFSMLLAVMVMAFACKPIEPDDPTKPTDQNGNGTEATPYTVAGAIKAASGNAWVKGYIVGFMLPGENTPVFSAETDTLNTNIIIADKVDETTTYMAIQLPKGAVRDGLNLAINKANLGQMVTLVGEIAPYFNTTGLRNTTYAVLGDKTFGTKPVEEGDAILYESFAKDLGAFTQVSVAGEQSWNVDSKYGYVMVSGYINADKTNVANEDWLISPAVKMPEGAAKMTIESVTRYFGNLASEATVWVSEDYTEGDPTTATWTQVACKFVEGADWTLTKSPEMNLTPYAGKTIRIAFKYVSTDKKAGTWELKNVLVEAGQAEEPAVEGEGTGVESDPYNVAGAIANQGKNAWVKGIIVGVYNFNADPQYVFGADTINTSLLIADEAGTPATFMTVQLPSGDVRNGLNLKDHAENLGKTVILYGSLEKYASKEGIKSVSYAKLGDTEFGIKPAETDDALFYESLTKNIGGFTVVDEVLPTGLTHIWSYDAKFKCVKATGYAVQKNDATGWLVSPSIDLSSAKNATLTFQNAGNYFVTPAEELQLWVSTTSDGTSFNEGWTQLTIDTYSTGGFSWAASTVNVDAYAGKSNVRFAFRYFSTPEMCGTWEIKEFMIK